MEYKDLIPSEKGEREKNQTNKQIQLANAMNYRHGFHSKCYIVHAERNDSIVMRNHKQLPSRELNKITF